MDDMDATVEELEKYKELYDQGAITEEEFSRLKQKALGLNGNASQKAAESVIDEKDGESGDNDSGFDDALSDADERSGVNGVATPKDDASDFVDASYVSIKYEKPKVDESENDDMDSKESSDPSDFVDASYTSMSGEEQKVDESGIDDAATNKKVSDPMDDVEQKRKELERQKAEKEEARSIYMQEKVRERARLDAERESNRVEREQRSQARKSTGITVAKTVKDVILWLVCVFMLFLGITLLTMGVAYIAIGIVSIVIAVVACPAVSDATRDIHALYYYYKFKPLISVLLVIAWVVVLLVVSYRTA